MEIRLIKDKELAASNDFHNAGYGTNRTLDQWHWEFDRRASENAARPFAVAVDNGCVVGTQALIPIPMVDAQGVYNSAKSEETLVDSEYRGQKLLERMYAVLKDYALEHDIRYIWGFTPADRAFRRVGFQTPRKTEQLFLPFSARAAAVVAGSGARPASEAKLDLREIATRTAVGAARLYSSVQAVGLRGHMNKVCGRLGLRLETATTPPEEAGDLCYRFVRRWGGTTIYRDSDYLRWRIFENPYLKPVLRTVWKGDQLVGWVAYSVGDEGIGYLVDLMVASSDRETPEDYEIARLLLGQAIVALKATGAFGIRGWRVNDHSFDRLVVRAARSVGFWHVRRGHTVVVLDQPGGEYTSGDNWFDDWYVTRIFTEGLAG